MTTDAGQCLGISQAVSATCERHSVECQQKRGTDTELGPRTRRNRKYPIHLDLVAYMGNVCLHMSATYLQVTVSI